MSTPKVYLNGRIVAADEARVSVFDVGLLHGASVFTTMLARDGRVFRLDRHLKRLMKSADVLAMSVACDRDILANGVADLLRVSSLDRARVRITLTPGSVRYGNPTVLITADELVEVSSEPLDVIVTEMRQPADNLTAGIKTGCFLPRLLAMQEAAMHGAQEALWFTSGDILAEACFSNVFLVRDGKLATPGILTPVLDGITRQAVIEIADQLEIAYTTDPLTLDDLLEADEVFLTSSCSGVRHVKMVEQHAVGDECPGAITRKISEAYQQLVETECASGDDIK